MRFLSDSLRPNQNSPPHRSSKRAGKKLQGVQLPCPLWEAVGEPGKAGDIDGS